MDVVGWMGPRMRQEAGFGDWSTDGVILGSNAGCPIVTNGEFVAQLCKSVSTIKAAV